MATEKILDLDATIEPGRAAAGIAIGALAASLPDVTRSVRTKLNDGVELVDFGVVRVWIRKGVIDQVGVRDGYVGRIRGGTVGVGSTIRAMQNALGPIAEDEEDNLRLAEVAGVCFEAETWRGAPGAGTIEDNLDAKVTEIFVFKAEPTHARDALGARA